MHYPDIPEDDVSYLEVKPEHLVPMPTQDKVWAQIGDDGQLAFIDWDLIEEFARQFDEINKTKGEKTHSHVICKLLTLVRKQAKHE